MFWQDLSSAAGGQLVEGSFPNSGGTSFGCTAGAGPTLNGPAIQQNLPLAKIGFGNFVYAYENNNVNWFGISRITSIDINGDIYSTSSGVTIPVIQAYGIDKKVDDGLPLSGNVITNYVNDPGHNGGTPYPSPNTSVSGGTTSSCYDTTTGAYSITQNGGVSGTCALSFRFQ